MLSFLRLDIFLSRLYYSLPFVSLKTSPIWSLVSFKDLWILKKRLKEVLFVSAFVCLF